MATEEWFFVCFFAPFIVFIGWIRWHEQRELIRTYKMFGTTGFYDVDRRFDRIYRANRGLGP